MRKPKWVGRKKPRGETVEKSVEALRGRAFGLDVESTFPLPGLRATAEGPADVVLERAAPEFPRGALGTPGGAPQWQAFIDGVPVALFAGDDGDHLLTFGSAAFHFDASCARVVCAGDATDPRWQRFVLDTVLWTASLLRGFELLHASSVCTPAGVVAFVAPQGFGKTSLALELMRSGHAFFADDILALEQTADGIVCHPGPAVMNVPRRRGWAHVGRRLADLDAKTWVEVDEAEQRPCQPAAVFVLEPGKAGAARPAQASALRLLPHSLGFRHLAHRQRTRFDVFCELASMAAVLTLPGARQASPAKVADRVQDVLARIGAGATVEAAAV